MKGLRQLILIGAMGLATALPATAAQISLFEFAFNVDGTVTSGAAPVGVSLAGFDTATGLGAISVSLAATGNHHVSLFLDHEIDEGTNTFFNEFGDTSATAPGASRSWEIDEPGFVFGDIYTNFVAGTLDNTNGVPAVAPDDVSMAMAWDFNLAAGKTAVVSFFISTTAPASGFYLAQMDPDSDAALYLTSALRISDGGQAPEPATLLLVGLGLLGAWQGRRRCADT